MKSTLSPLIALLLITSINSNAQCTVAVATTTGVTITNKTTYIEAYKLKFVNNDSLISQPVAAGQSITIMLAWCDTLNIVPQISMACGCGVPSPIFLYKNCGVLASPFQWYLERHGDWVTFTLLPVNVGQIKAAYPQEKVNGVFVDLDTIAGTELHEGVLYHRTVKIIR